MIKEIELQAPFFTNHQVISVFFGGGTPSVLDGEIIEKILCKLKGQTNSAGDTGAEFVLGINPRYASERSTRCRKRDGRTWAGREPWLRRRNGRR